RWLFYLLLGAAAAATVGPWLVQDEQASGSGQRPPPGRAGGLGLGPGRYGRFNAGRARRGAGPRAGRRGDGG
ncbi:hypothetical protein AB0J83_30300, partial [Actinoplanes sp. NPDC049596]